MESNNSVPVTSTSIEAKAPGTPSVDKKVGFARPTLIIPPPQAPQNSPKALLSVPVEALGPSYGRKTSQYMFDHINQWRDLGLSTAKTSLGFGEKFALWLYNKVKVLSKKWFTHCFLTIVLVIYTIGGAIGFKTIEEPYEGSVERPDLRALRYQLIEEVTNLSRLMPLDNQTEQWNSLATERIYAFFGQVIEDKKVEAFIEANRGDKVWTIWNSVVFCATIYTTIAMESGIVCHIQQAPENSGHNENNKNGEDPGQQSSEDNKTAQENSENTEAAAGKLAQLKAKTPDKDLPPLRPLAEKAKKPRQKRRIIHRDTAKRESTPIRYLGDEDAAKIADEIAAEGYNNQNGKEWSSSSASENISRQGSFRKGHAKKESISDLAQQELKSLFNKTKKSISSAAQRGRERFRKYEQQLAKRSQSAPQFVEELQESLQKVQQNDASLRRKYSDPDFTVASKAAPFELRLQLLRQGKPPLASAKIIEVLDAKTSSVVQRKCIAASGKTKQVVLSSFRTLSIRELIRNYQIHKRQFHREYNQIKGTFRRCCCELFLIMVFCGLGGLMFKFTEGTFETYYKCGVKRVKRDFIDLLWLKSHNLREDDWKSLARSRLRKFEEELHSAHEAGMTDYSGMRSWSFLNGIVYCLTILTTIGYGHMFPKTHTGRALTIVYALIGIPLFLIALTDFGKLFTRGIKFVWSFVRRLYYTGSCRKVRKNANMDDIFKGAQNLYDYATFKRPSLFDPNSPMPPESESQQQTETPTTPAISNFEIDDEFNLPISVALFILVSYIFCGAVMYMVIEKWNFFEAFYFVFISMSTIGFGDYVPRDPVFMIGSIIYLVFGLALMSMCINVVQAKLSDTFKQASSKIGATIGLEVDEDGSVITAAPENIEEVTPVRVEIANEIAEAK